MTPPNDIARCAGRQQPARMFWGSEGGLMQEYEWLPPCVDCQRCTDPGDVAHMVPPQFIDGACPSRLAPEGGV